VLDGLVINRAAIRKNLALLQGINMAEPVMIELTKKGMNRQDAHERVRVASMQALAENRSLLNVLSLDREVMRYCSKPELENLLNPDNYIGTSVQQVERVIGKLAALCERVS
jgi:adenylosuccinate lyase